MVVEGVGAVVVVEVEEEGLITHVLFAKHDWPPGQS